MSELRENPEKTPCSKITILLDSSQLSTTDLQETSTGDQLVAAALPKSNPPAYLYFGDAKASVRQ